VRPANISAPRMRIKRMTRSRRRFHTADASQSLICAAVVMQQNCRYYLHSRPVHPCQNFLTSIVDCPLYAAGGGCGLLSQALHPPQRRQPCRWGKRIPADTSLHRSSARMMMLWRTKTPKLRFSVKLNNQFVIPVVKGVGVRALVVMSLSLEVCARGGRDRSL